jgi:hypothetical protein
MKMYACKRVYSDADACKDGGTKMEGEGRREARGSV